MPKANPHYKIPDKVKQYLSRTSNRRKMLEKCGPDAFLDPERLRYPVKNPFTCKYDINLIHAAYVRSHEFKDRKIMAKADALWKKAQEGKLESTNKVRMAFTESVIEFDIAEAKKSIGRDLLEAHFIQFWYKY